MADIQFPNTILGPGTFTATVVDNNGAPSTVLEADTDFTVETAWTIDALSAALLGGEWEVSAYVESIGPGPEQLVGTTTVALTGATSYNAVVTVPGGTLPNDPGPPNSGVYKLVTVLTHRNFTKITNIAALVEGPVLRIG
jgi:hypothetical protein